MEDAIRENMSDLVELTNNVDDIVRHLREKEAISPEEAEEITGKESNFDKKSQLYWTILYKKDEATTGELLQALKITGNEGAAEKLGGGVILQTEVTVEPTPVAAGERTPDAEGMALADQIEKEFERIQSEVESEASQIVDEIEESIPAEVFEQGEIKEKPEINEESEVTVEVSSAPEEKSEPEIEEKQEIVEENGTEVEEEAEVQVNAVEEKVEVEAESKQEEEAPAPKSPKQVSFDEPNSKQEEMKEFTLNDDAERPSSPEDGKVSIVALNREKFEKPGTGPKVTYSFAKGKKDVEIKSSGVVAKGEEPPESTVKNLRNFWQKLGSVDKPEEGVQKRSGQRNGVASNRRTMI